MRKAIIYVRTVGYCSEIEILDLENRIAKLVEFYQENDCHVVVHRIYHDENNKQDGSFYHSVKNASNYDIALIYTLWATNKFLTDDLHLVDSETGNIIPVVERFNVVIDGSASIIDNIRDVLHKTLK